MLGKLVHVNSIVFIGLQALSEEEGTLDGQGLHESHTVATFVNLCHQFLHFKRMERSYAHQKFVQHDAKRPSINLVTVAFFLEELGGTVERGSADTELGGRAVDDCRETEVGNLSCEVDFSEVDLGQKLSFFAFGHGFELGVVWEVQQDVGQLHISVNDSQLPDDFNSLDYLVHDLAGFGLGQTLAHLEQHAQIKSIAQLLNHVNVGAGLDGLEETDTVVILDHAVKADLLLDAVHILLANVFNFNDFAREYLFPLRLVRRPQTVNHISLAAARCLQLSL